jgi:hypothetical protein
MPDMQTQDELDSLLDERALSKLRWRCRRGLRYARCRRFPMSETAKPCSDRLPPKVELLEIPARFIDPRTFCTRSTPSGLWHRLHRLNISAVVSVVVQLLHGVEIAASLTVPGQCCAPLRCCARHRMPL